MKQLGESVTSNTKCIGYYLRSMAITAIVTFFLPLVLIGVMLVLLAVLHMLLPTLDWSQEAVRRLHNFLSILGTGDSWQGVLLIGITASLVGMLFDTYAFYRYQGVTRR